MNQERGCQLITYATFTLSRQLNSSHLAMSPVLEYIWKGWNFAKRTFGKAEILLKVFGWIYFNDKLLHHTNVFDCLIDLVDILIGIVWYQFDLACIHSTGFPPNTYHYSKQSISLIFKIPTPFWSIPCSIQNEGMMESSTYYLIKILHWRYKRYNSKLTFSWPFFVLHCVPQPGSYWDR